MSALKVCVCVIRDAKSWGSGEKLRKTEQAGQSAASRLE